MSRTQSRHIKYQVAEGEHAGHRVVSDNYGIDFGGRDPRTAAYCLDCHESLVLVDTNIAAEQATAGELKG